MNRTVELAKTVFDAASKLQSFLADGGTEGGVVSFVGNARPATRDGTPVERLFLDHHPRLTLRSLDDIASAAIDRFSVTRVHITHRCGEIRPGEPIVFVAAAAAHRRAAFEAADYMMDRLKTDAFFWKREDAVDGPRWIEPTDADLDDRRRWSE